MTKNETLEKIKNLYKKYVANSTNPAWLKQKPEFFEYNPVTALEETQPLKNAIASDTANHFEKILDIGSGKGILCIAFSNIAKEIIGLEPDKDAREIAELTKEYFEKDNVKFIDGIAQKMPFENEAFDLVVSTSTLEHIDGTQNVIKEVFRVLKPNGYFYLNTPNYLWFREPHYILPMFPLMPKIFLKMMARMTNRNPKYIDHIQYLTPRFLNKILKSEGFTIKNISLESLNNTLFKNNVLNKNFIKKNVLHFLKLTRLNYLLYLFFKLTQIYPHIIIIARKNEE